LKIASFLAMTSVLMARGRGYGRQHEKGCHCEEERRSNLQYFESLLADKISFSLSLALICLSVFPFTAKPAGADQKADPAAPVFYYHFKMDGEFSGGEDLWINEVYLGKMPFTITLDELKAKVPFLAEPPEGYADEERRELKGDWFRLRLKDLVLRKDRRRGRSYDTPDRIYYVRVRLGDEWGIQGSGHFGGGGGGYRRDYNVGIRAEFPAREKRIAAKEQRFKNLLNIAQINEYEVGPDWYETVDTYGDEGWDDLDYRPSFGEIGVQKLLDGWVCWKFQINDPNDTQEARAAFERICEFVNTQKTYRFDAIEGHAVALIYDTLDLDELIRQYKRALASGKALSQGKADKAQMLIHEDKDGMSTVVSTYHEGNDVVPAAMSAVFHALRCWDAKLDDEDYNSDNPVELEVVPDLIRYHSEGHIWLEQAVQLGGPVMARFLLRQKQRAETRPNNQDRLFGGPTHDLNRWSFYLAEMDDPAGRGFRQENIAFVTEMADKMCERSAFSSHESAPALLFLDKDLGKQGFAWRYWERFSSIIETSSPSWLHHKLAKRFRYLNELGDLVPLQMYLDVWHDTHRSNSYRQATGTVAGGVTGSMSRTIQRKTKSSEPYESLYVSIDEAHRCLPNDKREAFERQLLEYYQNKLEGLGDPSDENRDACTNLEHAIHRLKGYLTPYPLHLLEHSIRPYPIHENRDKLQGLLNDPDPKIKQAAQKVAEELNRLKDIPLESLVADPAGKGTH